MSLSGINFSGLGSGIDTESIISQLMTLQKKPITRLQDQQKKITDQQTMITQIAALVGGLQAAAATLNGSTGFALVSGSSSDETVATLTADIGAQAGGHSLQVLQLAQAQRLGATAQPSQTAALGVSGDFLLNGKALHVAATDSLQAIAGSINSAQAGVNASIVSTTPSSYTLVLSAQSTGTANAISMSDIGGGTILQNTLGLIGAQTAVRSPVANGAASALFQDSATSLGTLMGMTNPPAGTIQINGVGIAIDFATDSLTSIAAKINTAGIAGVSASVGSVTDPVTGASKAQLTITGASTPTFTDAGHILTGLGILQNAPTNVLVEAKDASFKLDGLTITRSANTVKDVLSGVTLNLLKDTGQPTTSLSVATDTAGIKQNIQVFVNQYNQIVSTVGKATAFDPQTMTGGLLLGDIGVQSLMDGLADIITGTASGVTGVKSTLADIGITLDGNGYLQVNDSTLSAAMNADLKGVARIFQATGVASDSSVSFVSSTDKTRASAGTGYAIQITRAATQATLAAQVAHTQDDNPNTEALNFTGGQFGAGGRTLFLRANSTLDDIVSQINGDTMIAGVLTAAKVNNKLVLTAKQYGSAFNFNVSSSQPAAANNSGIGQATMVATAGDVEGTINGEAATGRGQFLTGADGNANTAGLQIRVASSMTGSLGTISFSRGIADQLKWYSQTMTDTVNGVLTDYAASLGQQAEDIGDSITALQDRLKDEESRLRTQFALMEGAIIRIKSAGSGLSALASLSTSSSSSSSSSSSK